MARSLPQVAKFPISPESEALLWSRLAAALRCDDAEEVVTACEERLEAHGLLGLAFDDARESPDDRVVTLRDRAIPDETWFLGDLHGDLLALEAAFLHVESRSTAPEGPTVVLLGDLIDDGIDSYALLLAVLRRAVARPGKLALIAGNHDAALACDGDDFASETDPSDFAPWLNARPGDALARRAGRLAVRVFQTLPRAIFFPDGLLAAHGGFPLPDLFEGLAERRDFNDPRCLQDFTWTRAHPTAPKKIPNRYSKTCQFGHEDFSRFCEHASKVLEMPVERMIRGHDHFEMRYFTYPEYKDNPMLAINTMSHRLGREGGTEYPRPVCVARHRPGLLPEVNLIFPQGRMVQALYPPPAP